MALKVDFYNKIFEEEKKWMELINLNLLNSIYCNLVLKPFYEERKKELEQEFKLTGNKIIELFIISINNIINQIDTFNDLYKNSQNPDMKLILPLFLINQMNNTNVIERPLSNMENQSNLITNDNDYVYDDFPEVTRRIK